MQAEGTWVAPFTELDMLGAFAVHIESLLTVEVEDDAVPGSAEARRADLDAASERKGASSGFTGAPAASRGTDAESSFEATSMSPSASTRSSS